MYRLPARMRRADSESSANSSSSFSRHSPTVPPHPDLTGKISQPAAASWSPPADAWGSRRDATATSASSIFQITAIDRKRVFLFLWCGDGWMREKKLGNKQLTANASGERKKKINGPLIIMEAGVYGVTRFGGY
ncbi:F-box and associated interaction domains-containing protein [Striga asiatica]|uniref:F-box and associated interaction domains-containing protein n=1 Tax=Striga asiatica TaxID=4170 RepID=A0A5A7PJY2_STRAF|nr:F-box and associated interaction domains-containing protein [Striga asiatica]